ncbi:hypothetical protein GCM10009760_28340 [Kitasatospora kazusensis]|uniref:Uncharacterized protein n=1 Tax=Kitasatospora kazusensis TaxID=407974 RepID=A0ABP5LBR3_9ACTN
MAATAAPDTEEYRGPSGTTPLRTRREPAPIDSRRLPATPGNSNRRDPPVSSARAAPDTPTGGTADGPSERIVRAACPKKCGEPEHTSAQTTVQTIGPPALRARFPPPQASGPLPRIGAGGDGTNC